MGDGPKGSDTDALRTLGLAGHEILGNIDGLKKISIVWESETFFSRIKGLFIYNLFKKFRGLIEANVLSGFRTGLGLRHKMPLV